MQLDCDLSIVLSNDQEFARDDFQLVALRRDVCAAELFERRAIQPQQLSFRSTVGISGYVD